MEFQPNGESPKLLWDEMERLTGKTKQGIRDLVSSFYPLDRDKALDILSTVLGNSAEIGKGHSAYSLAIFLITVIWHEIHMEYTLVPDTRPLFYEDVGAYISKN